MSAARRRLATNESTHHQTRKNSFHAKSFHFKTNANADGTKKDKSQTNDGRRIPSISIRNHERQQKMTRALGRRYTGGRSEWMRMISQLLNDPSSSTAAFFVNSAILFLIVASVVLNILMTVDGLDNAVTRALESIFAVIFTVELVLRCCVQYGSFSDVWKDTFFFIDLAAIIGFYVRLVVPELTVMKAFRGFRLLKICRHHDGGNTLVAAIEESLEALKVPIFFLLIASVMFGLLLFHVEEAALKLEGVDRPEHKIKTAGHAVWFMVVTMSTVGYGDIVPETVAGRLLVIVAILLGVLFMAMPLAIMGTNFVRVWEERHIYKAAAQLKALLHLQGTDREALVSTFTEFDYDHSGLLSIDELAFCFSHLGLELSRKEMLKVWKAIDSDNAGTVCIEEFIDFIFPNSDESADRIKMSPDSKGERNQPTPSGSVKQGSVAPMAMVPVSSMPDVGLVKSVSTGATATTRSQSGELADDLRESTRMMRRTQNSSVLALEVGAADQIRPEPTHSAESKHPTQLVQTLMPRADTAYKMGGALVNQCKESVRAIRQQKQRLRDKMRQISRRAFFEASALTNTHWQSDYTGKHRDSNQALSEDKEMARQSEGRIDSSDGDQSENRKALQQLELAAEAAAAALMTAELYAEVQRNVSRMVERAGALRTRSAMQHQMAAELVGTASRHIHNDTSQGSNPVRGLLQNYAGAPDD